MSHHRGNASFWGSGRPSEHHAGSLPYYYYEGGLGVRDDPFWGPADIWVGRRPNLPGRRFPMPPPPTPRHGARRSPVIVSVGNNDINAVPLLLATGVICLGLLAGGVVAMAASPSSSSK